jgi:membrane protease subunit HflK
VVVPPGSQALVRRFGAPAGTPRGEGLHAKLPFPIDRAEILHSAGVHRIEIGFRTPVAGETNWLSPDGQPAGLEDEGLYLTGDENIVDTKATVQYRIANPARWRWGFSDVDATIRVEAIAELVDVLAARSIDGFYTDDRRAVEARVREGLQRRIEALDLGIEIAHFGILSVHAPPEVHAAFRDVASAQEDKQREIDIAFRYLDETVNLARGEAAARVEDARATSTSAVLRAEGDSQSLRERIAAYRARPEGTRSRLYLETMEEVLARSTKIVRPSWKGSGSVDLWISGKNGAPVPAADVVKEERSESP